MINSRLKIFLSNKSLSVPLLRYFHHEFSQPEATKKADSTHNNKSALEQQTHLAGAVRHKYKVFRDEDAAEIFDVEEERQRYQVQDEPEEQAALHNEYLGLNLKRGLHGVFDVEDLVDVLRKESAEDIFVCLVPKELNYVEHLVVCSGRSYRHMLATAEFVRRMYKIKRTKRDVLPKIEGEKSRDWMALDLGNIALHIFSPSAREEYDLESLWAIGPEYDKECNKPQDPLIELFERHTSLLADVKPKS